MYIYLPVHCESSLTSSFKSDDKLFSSSDESDEVGSNLIISDSSMDSESSCEEETPAALKRS